MINPKSEILNSKKKSHHKDLKHFAYFSMAYDFLGFKFNGGLEWL